MTVKRVTDALGYRPSVNQDLEKVFLNKIEEIQEQNSELLEALKEVLNLTMMIENNMCVKDNLIGIINESIKKAETK
jgi:hypothetical protein